MEVRITEDWAVMGGAAVFAGTRLPIDTVLASLAGGTSLERLQASWPFLTEAHVDAARAWRTEHLREPGRPLSSYGLTSTSTKVVQRADI